MRPLAFLIVALLAAVFSLGVYSYPKSLEALQPGGEIVVGLIPNILTMAIEIAAILIGIHYYNDRRWHKARAIAARHILLDAADMEQVFRNLVAAHARGGSIATEYRLFKERVVSPRLLGEMQYLAPSFTPELACDIADYMQCRKFISIGVDVLTANQFRAYFFNENISVTNKAAFATGIVNTYYTAQWLADYFETYAPKHLEGGPAKDRCHELAEYCREREAFLEPYLQLVDESRANNDDNEAQG